MHGASLHEESIRITQKIGLLPHIKISRLRQGISFKQRFLLIGD